MYSHVHFVYIVIRFLTAFIFYSVGKKMAITKNNKKYWSLAILPILSFTVLFGLRFGRLIDFNYYCDRYYEMGRNIDAGEYEYIFKNICHYMASIGIPYQFFIILCSLALVVAVFNFLKPYKEGIMWMGLLFLQFNGGIEMLVRWSLAAVFFITGITYLKKMELHEIDKRNAYLKYLIYSLITCNIHAGFFPLVFFFLIIWQFRFFIFKPYLILILFILSLFLGHPKIFQFLNDYVQLFDFSDKASYYSGSFETIISEGTKTGMTEYNILTQIRFFLLFSLPIYFLNDLFKLNKVSYQEINIWAIAIILYPILNRVEILDRYSHILNFYIIIINGITYWHCFKYFNKLSATKKIFLLLSVISMLYPYIVKTLDYKGYQYMLFYWDSMGREKLPESLFY